jgi:hypothetical protein
VRSSATAEDLPGLSFAGQQETFLNVTGAEAVVAAVRNCWASLWNPQAIAYRHQNGLDQNTVAMAVVVQIMIPSDVAGILFTANPATGKRDQMIINASFGLGEAVVGGTVTPDTFMVDKTARAVTETVLGPKEQKIISDGAQGVVEVDVSDAERQVSSLSAENLKELIDTGIAIEGLYDGLYQDIEWAFSGGTLYMLQSRPITLLPADPDHPDIDLTWTPRSPARFLTRRQIVENMPDPICPLFEELYLTEGLGAESSYQWDAENQRVGGPNYMTLNGYAYQRFDFRAIQDRLTGEQDDDGTVSAPTDEEIEAAERAATLQAEQQKQQQADVAKQEYEDMERMVADLSEEDRAGRKQRFFLSLHYYKMIIFAKTGSGQTSGTLAEKGDLLAAFRAFEATQPADVDPLAAIAWEQRSLAHRVTMPKSDNPTYVFAHKSDFNEGQLAEYFEVTRPELIAMKDKWSATLLADGGASLSTADDEVLLDAIREMALAEGFYWTSNASHTFGVAKSTDDHLQCFLRETLPEHNYISGQFLSGLTSPTGEPLKSIAANHDLFEVAKLIRQDEVRKRWYLFRRFILNNRTLAKTGSGQAQGKLTQGGPSYRIAGFGVRGDHHTLLTIDGRTPREPGRYRCAGCD